MSVKKPLSSSIRAISVKTIGMVKRNKILLTFQQDATGRRQEEHISMST
jgi:hypothetical protein